MADAFVNLEGVILDLRANTYLLELAARDTVMRVNHPYQQLIREKFDEGTFEGCRICVLSEEQANGLDHALLRLGDLVRQLHREYYSKEERET